VLDGLEVAKKSGQLCQNCRLSISPWLIGKLDKGVYMSESISIFNVILRYNHILSDQNGAQ
jgi:hypothetical protein